MSKYPDRLHVRVPQVDDFYDYCEPHGEIKGQCTTCLRNLVSSLRIELGACEATLDMERAHLAIVENQRDSLLSMMKLEHSHTDIQRKECKRDSCRLIVEIETRKK